MIIQGHVLEVLATMPDEFFDCVITSPPYWGLRDYGVPPLVWDGVEGCEHVWGGGIIKRTELQAGNPEFKRPWRAEATAQSTSAFCTLCGAWRGSLGLEPTYRLYLDHLMQVTAECKRVLKKTGTMWVNIGDSYAGLGKGIGTDRNKCKGSYTDDDIAKTDWGQCNIPAKSLVGIPERFAIAMTDELGMIRRNTIIWWKRNAMPSSAKDRFTVDFEPVYFFVKNGRYWFEQQKEGDNHYKTIAKVGQKRFGGNTSPGANTIREDRVIETIGRNMRTVWDIPTKPFPEAHFAVFPDTLVEPMLSAGCPPDGWVLDPFAGAGTVGIVAKRQGKNFIGIELNPEYVVMAERRITHGA